MPNFVFFIKQLFRLVYFYLFLSSLFGQAQSEIVHADIISESDKVEISFIFDEIIDRDDVSGWIDRTNYFTLSLFNISLNSREIFLAQFFSCFLRILSEYIPITPCSLQPTNCWQQRQRYFSFLSSSLIQKPSATGATSTCLLVLHRSRAKPLLNVQLLPPSPLVNSPSPTHG